MSDKTAHGHAVWLETRPDPVLTFLHLPPPGAPSRSAAVLIVPPFGWEEVCSYRSRRAWADRLAAAGFPAARLDLPGTGDSGGYPRDRERLAAWTSAVADAARWLRSRTGRARTAAIGIGVGGLVAWRAAEGGAPIDDLVLWGVSRSGRRTTRELRAQSAVIAGRHPADTRPAPPGELDAAGHLITEDTLRAIEAATLGDLPEPGRRRVLLLGRGSLGVDTRLREQLEPQGLDVTVLEAEDYEQMMDEPQFARVPDRTIARSLEWLAADARPAAEPPALDDEPPAERSTLALRSPSEGSVRETPLELTVGSARLFAVMTEPLEGAQAQDFCAVLMNPGTIRHTGPHRMWVELARRWGAQGIRSVRVDLPGIGDADDWDYTYERTANLYVDELVEQTVGVLGALEALGIPGKFMIVGMCSSAHWGLHAALADPRVFAATLVNLVAIDWTEALAEQANRRGVLLSLAAGDLRRRVLNRDLSREELRELGSELRPDRVLAALSRSAEVRAREVNRIFDRLGEQGTQVQFLLSRDERFLKQLSRQKQLARLRRWPNLDVQLLPGEDHLVRAVWLQHELHHALDRALARVLARTVHPDGEPLPVEG